MTAGSSPVTIGQPAAVAGGLTTVTLTVTAAAAAAGEFNTQPWHKFLGIKQLTAPQPIPQEDSQKELVTLTVPELVIAMFCAQQV